MLKFNEKNEKLYIVVNCKYNQQLINKVQYKKRTLNLSKLKTLYKSSFLFPKKLTNQKLYLYQTRQFKSSSIFVACQSTIFQIFYFQKDF